MAEQPQTYANHTKRDPPFHFFLLPLAAILVGWAVADLVRSFTSANLYRFLFAFAFAFGILMMRRYSVKVQDRLIRLEERLRLERILPATMHHRILELSPRQLVALRFAPDAELASLVEQTLAQNWGNAEIKKAIREWRPDYFRV